MSPLHFYFTRGCEMKTAAEAIAQNGRTYGLPFMKLGTAVNTMSSTEAMHQGDANFTVEKRQLDFQGTPVPAWGVFRTDKSVEEGFLSQVGSDYQTIQNPQMFEWADAVLGESGSHYVCSGTLNGGRQLFAVAKLPQSYTVGKNDKHDVYLAFVGSHDRSISNQLKIIHLRLVCNNGLVTVSSAMGGSNRNATRIVHRGNVDKRMTNAKTIMARVGNSITDMSERLNVLAKRKITPDAMQHALTGLLGENWDTTDNWRKQQQIITISQLFNLPEFPEQEGTAFALLNAYTNYTDHRRMMRSTDIEGTTIERTQAAYFGSGVQQKTKALEVILEATKSCPTIEAKPTRAVGSTSKVDDILNMVNWKQDAIHD